MQKKSFPKPDKYKTSLLFPPKRRPLPFPSLLYFSTLSFPKTQHWKINLTKKPSPHYQVWNRKKASLISTFKLWRQPSKLGKLHQMVELELFFRKLGFAFFFFFFFYFLFFEIFDQNCIKFIFFYFFHYQT